MISHLFDSVKNASIAVLYCLCHAEIDHCADGTHGCEQESMNTKDSCVCKCRSGFELRPDGKTCKSACLMFFSTCYLKKGFCRVFFFLYSRKTLSYYLYIHIYLRGNLIINFYRIST